MDAPTHRRETTSSATVPLLDPSHELPPSASPNSTGHEPEKKMWVRFVVLGFLLVAVIAFIVWRIQGNKATEQKENARSASFSDRPVPVTVQRAKLESIPIYLNALGTVTAYNTVSVKSRVDGEITKVNFVEGQHVKQGQTLIQIDPRPYEAALAQAKGNLARDQANAAFAAAQANRYTALYQAGVVSRESEQTQQSTAGQATGTIEGDKAAIQAAQVNLGYTRITSPITGIVGLRQVDIGNVIAANSSNPLVVITQVQPIAVIFTLPEDQIQQVRAHMKNGSLKVEAWDRSNTTKIADGQLLTIDNQIDTTTGTAKLKAVFQNSDEALFPNQFVNVRLILETRQNAIIIPSTALQTGENSTNFVYVVDMSNPITIQPSSAAGSGKSSKSSKEQANTNSAPRTQTAYIAHARLVKVSLTQGTQVVLDSGLNPGDVVVTDGQEKLKDGSKVSLPANTTGTGLDSNPRSGRRAGASQASPGGKPTAHEASSNGAQK